MENLYISLNTFIDNMSIASLDKDNSFIPLYKSATLVSTDIIRADPSYNNAPWFSDVAIVMDEIEITNYIIDQEACFGKVGSNSKITILKYKIIYLFNFMLDIANWRNSS